MDFSAKTFKGLMTDVGTVFTRARQYAEETIGKSERTELDGQFENLADRSDKTKLWTERIVAKAEAVLQPNPNLRYGDFIFDKIDPESKKERMRNLEWLGNDMIDAGIDFGPGTIYGSGLIKVGKTQQKLGQTEKEFVINSYRTFVQPLRRFLDEDMKTITKERKILENKRLDLDAAKNRLKKAKTMETQANVKPDIIAKEIDQAEQELNLAQEEFERQMGITKLLLEGVSSAHANHVRYLNDYVKAQIDFYARCHQHMCELQRELANMSSTGSISNRQQNDLKSPSDENNMNLTANKRRAKVLYDYDARNDKEVSLTANEVIIVSELSDSSSDWVIVERGNQKGKVPLSYLELIK